MTANTPHRPDAVVFGATGFLGRWTTLELLRQGRSVAAVIRKPGGLAASGQTREAELRGWFTDHGASTEGLTVVGGDLTSDAALGIDAADERRLGDVRDVFNLAGNYRFGMARPEARIVNVDGALNVLNWAAARRDLRRLIHVSGYRVSPRDEPRYPIPESELDRLYRTMGAYEASKIEADAAVRVVADRRGVPLTVVNPSAVIGHSETGEAGQYIGPAELVRQLWNGKLPVLPGTAETFVPVVTVDYAAKFLCAIPEHDSLPGGRHWLLDDETPRLPELVSLVAERFGVRAPRRLVPVGVVRRLPAAITGADPETLTFLSEDRYDTGSADRVARSAGLSHPPVETALRRWADRLVADGFGTLSAVSPGGFADVAGSQTYLAGDRITPDVVLLHGLPLDGESWRPVLGELSTADASSGLSTLVADLPGLGRSAGSAVDVGEWMADLLAPIRTRPVIVAHSAATALALRYVASEPEKVAGLVLVSPYFIQRRTPAPLRIPAITAPVLKRLPRARLDALLGVAEAATAAAGAPGVTARAANAMAATATTGAAATTAATAANGAIAPAATEAAVESAAASLRRPGVARRMARMLKHGGRSGERAALERLLRDLPSSVPLHIVHGEHDPLIGDPGPGTVSTIPGAGHNPQLTHPAAVTAILREVTLATRIPR
ncbi:alpha/beta fold hydrolase [Stackebrandtia nassauensis]|uniref:Male sterility domain protein n=1 Tax=Stackebrandtia nassauensis (strain DSM 44728 / CIP 108903 / NRRL B-16338 / NBRC 102104 / LLR-40K-21) TaxID=446470 RepID=D3Q9V6_STANL|nr:alpha/beta fold hydrolase [Stackebrandtia nassauensis]ADD44652.1 Male sterility domain protein [Stackebrandtia nassauensis DSM 44728]